MALSAPGIGSNLDVNNIISQLMTLERQPLAALDNKEAAYQAKLSAYGTLKSALSTFQGSVHGLSNLSKFQAVKASPADATVLTASAMSNAVPGNYAINVTQLAKSQTVMADGKADMTSVIGNGTLTFQFGTISGGSFDSGTGHYTGATFTQDAAQASKTVTIDATNNNLQGIRDAINAAAVGVTATIVNDGSATPYRLVLTSNATGAASSMKISVSGDAALQNLLAYNPAGTQNLAQTSTAQNAALTVNGVSVTGSSNSISGAIQGVTLNLLKDASSTTLTVTRDSASVQTAVQSFVDAYNSLNKVLNDMTAYDAATKQAAVLQGDFTVANLRNQVRSTLNSTIAGLSGNYTLLSQIGVSFQSNGTMKLDSSKLQAAVSSNFADIAGLFADTGKPSDSLISYSSATTKTTPGSYAVNVTRLATKGTLVGAAAANTTISAGSNDTLTFAIDGVTASVTLTAGVYTAATLAAMVQSAINGVSAFSSMGVSVAVTESAGVLTLTSNRYGSASTVSVTGGNGATDLLGVAPVSTAGLDAAGTINNVTASGAGQYLTGATGDVSEGLKIQVTGGSTGARGTVNYSQGYAYKLDRLMDGFLASTGPLSSRTDGITSSIKDINSRREALNRRLVDIERRYRIQFASLDKMMSSMNQTSNYLAQQLANLPK
ncbi:MAG: flagellar filament capping protein FliD [Pseudomonadota bacterium]